MVTMWWHPGADYWSELTFVQYSDNSITPIDAHFENNRVDVIALWYTKLK
jgi:hypothetical protein